MENTVFERNYETTEKDDRARAVFERAFAPGGFMEEFTKKMDAIPKIVVPKDKENYEYLLNRCDDYAKRHHGRIRGVVDYEHWDAHIDLYLKMLEFDDAEDMCKQSSKVHTFSPANAHFFSASFLAGNGLVVS